MTKVKLCGLRRREDILAANDCRPDYVGFVFAGGSKRRLDEQTAAALKDMLHPDIAAVGVFVNQDPAWIVSLCKKGIIDCIQLHGDEDEAYLAALKAMADYPVIRSASVGKSVQPTSPLADYMLYDTASVRRGGSGRRFDWALLKQIGGRYFLAGGLDAGNAAEAVRLLSPYCLDVSSGVETGDWKDPIKMEQFVCAVREARGD